MKGKNSRKECLTHGGLGIIFEVINNVNDYTMSMDLYRKEFAQERAT
jgi:hypothetical protein